MSADKNIEFLDECQGWIFEHGHTLLECDMEKLVKLTGHDFYKGLTLAEMMEAIEIFKAGYLRGKEQASDLDYTGAEKEVKMTGEKKVIATYSMTEEDDRRFKEELERIINAHAPDQSCKEDEGKPKLSLVPSQIIRDIARVREYGNAKYGDSENWRQVEVDRYVDAAYRHLLAFVEDKKSVDAESGIPHYMHLACNLAFLCELLKEKE